LKEITVIICTYNRGDLLKETLPTILNQNISKKQFTILVIDNNSTDRTKQIIINFKKQYNNLEYIFEPKQGTSFARNTGHKYAKTDWIIFLDDDAKVSDSFLKIALNIINENNLDCFGGIYYPWYKYEKPKWFKDKYVSTGILFNDKNIATQHTYISAGIMAIKKDVLENINGFSTRLGPNGNKMYYGEETHLHQKLIKNGYTTEIKTEWSMHHLVDKMKYRFRWFFKNGLAIGRDYWIIYEDKASVKKMIKYTIYTIITFLKNTKQILNRNYNIQNWIAENLKILAFEYGRQTSGIKLLLKGLK